MGQFIPYKTIKYNNKAPLHFLPVVITILLNTTGVAKSALTGVREHFLFGTCNALFGVVEHRPSTIVPFLDY